ncbi:MULTISPECIES: N-acyl homoserine lactonase family protein [Pseudonocardia]|uniref:N-acyl homoserine lactonase family protein n=1 Tax=Pseudonocardia abyssalis TaxID=2792008 RepID=A0ABS6V306_9PSEU|nr:N-acyl homoserine lactonase family protein [Pseudonocardia abyssalis]MBW0113973.1 N-acyl homoserine lactonase family protein [Pseudonocardia abyssalis]MBW0138404.1 N-acyl homoserine lactonase family protein [Pseudonocardia abyssalis]
MATPGTAKRMWALDSPTFTVDKSLLLLGAAGECTIPMPAYLIEHPKGLVLFDTGLVPAAATDPEGVYGPLAEHLGLRFSPEQTVDAQLDALGYKLSDIKYVIASHTHFDHTGGLYLFPDARFYVGEGDMRFGFWPDPAGAGFFRQADLEPLRGRNVLEVPGVDHDVFGDGSVVILFTPGHTPGELSLLVRLPGRNFILTGDTVHLRDALTTIAPMPHDADTVQALRSIRRLNLLRDSADATIWISHDPEDWAEFKHAPNCFE